MQNRTDLSNTATGPLASPVPQTLIIFPTLQGDRHSAQGRPEAKRKEPKHSLREKTTTCWEWCRECARDRTMNPGSHTTEWSATCTGQIPFISPLFSWCPLERSPCLRCAKKHPGVSLTAGGTVVAVKMLRAKWKVQALRGLLRLHPSTLDKVVEATVQSTGDVESQGTTPFSAQLPCSHPLREPGRARASGAAACEPGESCASPPGLSVRRES